MRSSYPQIEVLSAHLGRDGQRGGSPQHLQAMGNGGVGFRGGFLPFGSGDLGALNHRALVSSFERLGQGVERLPRVPAFVFVLVTGKVVTVCMTVSAIVMVMMVMRRRHHMTVEG